MKREEVGRIERNREKARERRIEEGSGRERIWG